MSLVISPTIREPGPISMEKICFSIEREAHLKVVPPNSMSTY